MFWIFVDLSSYSPIKEIAVIYPGIGIAPLNTERIRFLRTLCQFPRSSKNVEFVTVDGALIGLK